MTTKTSTYMITLSSNSSNTYVTQNSPITYCKYLINYNNLFMNRKSKKAKTCKIYCKLISSRISLQTTVSNSEGFLVLYGLSSPNTSNTPDFGGLPIANFQFLDSSIVSSQNKGYLININTCGEIAAPEINIPTGMSELSIKFLNNFGQVINIDNSGVEVPGSYVINLYFVVEEED